MEKGAEMKVLILGSTGLLGCAVGKHFLTTKHETTLTYRNEAVSYGKDKIFFDPLRGDIDKTMPQGWPHRWDYVINCIGIIKPFVSGKPIETRKINAVFPWELANWCHAYQIKLIHISTDCVFSGRKGRYVESDLHDALDDYGKSKSLGEPNNSMVIRTSIIGEEIHNNTSLIEWAKSQKGKEVNGFANHYWNGVTTKQYAKVCENVIDNNLWENGLFHVHAADIVRKYDMLTYFNERFDLNLTINEFKTPEICDRSLSSEKDLCSKLKVPTVRDQVMAM